MELSLFKRLNRRPFIFNAIFHEGIEQKHHRSCLKCKDLQCYKYFRESKSSEYICDLGYNSYAIQLNSNVYIFNGLISKRNKTISIDRRNARKEYIIDEAIILSEIHNLKEIESCINQQITSNIEQNFSLFHDIKTTYNLVISSTQNYIQKQEGKRFEEKLSNCPQEIIDLYDSLELVNSQFGMIDIIINPQAIQQGEKKPINIYKLFHKIAQLFSNKFSNQIQKENKEIKWFVKDYKTVPDIECYDSIELIPIILIDNAIKYSSQNTKITISYEVSNSEVITTISSFGPTVKDTNIENIFRKNVRGENAQNFTNKGIGMGLWIAKNILKHHSSTITYSKENERDGFGINKFRFSLKI